jgi:hypothetical protein
MSAANENDPLTDSALCTGDPLAKALAVLEPMPTALNRDQLMFAAGAAGRDRAVIFWKRIVCGQAVAACLAVGIGIALSDSPSNTRGDSGKMPVAENASPVPAPKTIAPTTFKATPTPAPSASEDSEDTTAIAKYLQLRSNVLSLGVNALPNPIAPPSNVDVGSLEDSLQLPRGTFAIHGMPAKKKAPDEND